MQAQAVALLLCLAAAAGKQDPGFEATRNSVVNSEVFQKKVEASCQGKPAGCQEKATDLLFCELLKRAKPQMAADHCGAAKAPEDDLAKEMTHDLEMNFNKIAPFGKEDT